MRMIGNFFVGSDVFVEHPKVWRFIGNGG